MLFRILGIQFSSPDQDVRKTFVASLLASFSIALVAALSHSARRDSPVQEVNKVAQQSERDAYPVQVHQPAGPPKLQAETPTGETVEIACSTCHATRKPNPANHQTADLDQFHQGLAVRHGKLVCLSCHNPNDYDTLRLADGQSLEFRSVMTLCGQCHGPQYRDYQHGSHGGMTGYWDLSKGPRRRNNCTDCHDPHAPAFPLMTPVFPPADRFKPKHEAEHAE